MKTLQKPIVACLALALALGATMAAPSVEAQQNQNCAPRAKVLARLSDEFGETRQSVGLGSNKVLVETFASAETGTWTITVTMPSGVTCLVASGKAFETASVALPDIAPPSDL